MDIRFPKWAKLARDRNFMKTLMGVGGSAGDLLTIRKLKNIDAGTHFHNDQHNQRARKMRFQTSKADDSQVCVICKQQAENELRHDSF